MLEYNEKLTTEKMLNFLASLRYHGYRTGISEAQDAVKLASSEMIFEKPRLRLALKHLLSSNHDQWQRFDHLFELYFRDVEDEGEGGGNQDTNKRTDNNGDGSFQIVADFYQGETDLNQGGAGRNAAVTKTDFRFLTEKEGWEEAARATEALAKSIKMRNTRRWRNKQNGKRIDLRSTARRLAATDGDPLWIGRKSRKRKPLHVITLLDVSHSMSYYSPMLARFTRGLVHNFDKSEAFCFHIELNRITDLLLEKDMEVMRERMEAIQNLWYGGTNIAASLQKFHDQYLFDYATQQTVVLLISDGCDTCCADEILRPLRQIHQNVRKIIWVNPIQARLERINLLSSSPLIELNDYIDGRVSGDSFHSLQQLARLLSR